MSDGEGKSPFDPEKMKGNFDRLMRSTVDGLEELKEVLVRASQEAKTKLDATLLRRERDRLYQQLGELAYLQIEEGKLKAPAGLRDTLDRIHAIVEQLAAEEAAKGDGGSTASSSGLDDGYDEGYDDDNEEGES